MIINEGTNIAAFGALIISILSFTVSLMNYYKSLEPALNIKVINPEGVHTTPVITKIVFKNPTNNAFHNLSISAKVIKKGFPFPIAIGGRSNEERYLPNLYLAPQDEGIISLNFFNHIFDELQRRPEIITDTKHDLYLLITYSYRFMLKKRTYHVLYKWNIYSENWEWEVIEELNPSIPSSEEEARAKHWWQFWR